MGDLLEPCHQEGIPSSFFNSGTHLLPHGRELIESSSDVVNVPFLGLKCEFESGHVSKFGFEDNLFFLAYSFLVLEIWKMKKLELANFSSDQC
jgi:hypothetical protein